MPATQQGTTFRHGKVWKSRIVIDGKASTRVTRTKDEGREWCREQIKRGPVDPDSPQTVDALFDLYLERHGRTLDPATLKTHTARLKHARKAFGNRAPNSLRQAEIEDLLQGLSDGVRFDVCRTIKQSFRWAHDRGLVATNPAAKIKNARRRKHERREVFPFKSWAEIEAVSAELHERYRAIPIVAAATGLRPEELFGLRREDWDKTNQRLHVRRRFTGGILKDGTKTGSERFVPLNGKAVEALEGMTRRIDTPVLFPAPRGGHIDIEKFRHREWAPALRAAGLPHHRLYDLRNTAATWLLDAGVPAPNVAEMLGTSVSQLEDTYNRPHDDVLASYAARLDTYGKAVAQ